MTDHPYDDIEALALGDLDEVTARRAMDHADRCHVCAVLVAQAFGGVAALDPGEERPLQKLRTLDLASVIGNDARAVDFVSTERRGRRPLLTGLATLAAGLAAMIVWNVDLRSNLKTVPIDALVRSHFLHHPLTGPSGSAKVIVANDGSWVYLVADGLVPRGRYELWERRGALLTRLGAVSADNAGRGAEFWGQPPGSTSGFVLTPTGSDPLRDQRALRWP